VLKEAVISISPPRKIHKTTFIAGLAIALILIILGVLLIPKLIKPKEQVEKSIAVLPFIDDSPGKDNSHIIDGVMEEILINLQKIKDLRVVSRNSVEQYREESKPSTPEVAKQLGVNYIVEGSGQKYGNTIRLRVQLIVIKGGKESHLWGESYEQEINEVRDYFIIQSKIAESIATEMKAIITPEEKTLIEKAPTDDLEAYIFYQKGKEQYLQYEKSFNQKYFRNAEHFFRQAIETDPTFALAYVELARVFLRKEFYYENYSGSALDSIEILLNTALSLDNQLAEAYSMRGRYISETGLISRAIEDYNKALTINPNYWEAYTGLAFLYNNDDLLKTIQNRHKAVELNHGPEFPVLLRNLADAYLRAGFVEIAQKYNIDAFKIHSDSSRFISFLTLISYMLGNYDEAAEYGIRDYSIDSSNKQALYKIANNYSLSGRFKEGLEYFKKYINESDSSAVVYNEMHRIG
jgi:TolB-like protein/tetratricopeptide (TPR) repeat protein